MRALSAPRRFSIDDIYSTEGSEPPNKPPPPKQSGDYCFRAETSFSIGKVTTYKYVGYSRDFSISNDVMDHCMKHKNNLKYGNCSDVKLAFIGAHPKCDGRVEQEKVSDTP